MTCEGGWIHRCGTMHMEEPHVFECQLCYTCVHVCVLSCFSCVRLFATLWTLALQAPLSMRFSMQEYWSGLQSPPSEGLPHPEIQPVSLLSSDWQTIFFFNHEATWGARKLYKDFQVHRAWYLIENLVQLYHGSSARMSQHLICSFQNPQCGGRASFLCLFSSPWSFPCYFSRNSSSTLPCFQESESHLVVSDSLQPHGLYSPWNSPGQNTEVDSFSFFQGIFATQGSNPGLPHCRQILYDMNQETLAF